MVHLQLSQSSEEGWPPQRLTHTTPGSSSSELLPCWSVSLPISSTVQMLGSSVTLVVLFPLQTSHAKLLCCWWMPMCYLPHCLERVEGVPTKKNFTSLTHVTSCNISFANKPMTSLETTGLKCCKLSLGTGQHCEPNHALHGLPHLCLLVISVLVYGL